MRERRSLGRAGAVAFAAATLAGAAAGAPASPVGAAAPAPAVELRRLFPQEAEVTAGPGLSRLILPAAVLTACRPDLSDLRLFDARDKEVPFLIDAGAGRPAGFEITQRFEPRVLEAARAEIRRPNGPPLRRETLEIGLPAAAPQTGSWVLVVEPRRAEFVARVGWTSRWRSSRRARPTGAPSSIWPAPGGSSRIS